MRRVIEQFGGEYPNVERQLRTGLEDWEEILKQSADGRQLAIFDTRVESFGKITMTCRRRMRERKVEMAIMHGNLEFIELKSECRMIETVVELCQKTFTEDL